MSILIVDFGSQYTHLITKCINYKLCVPAQLIPFTKIDSYTAVAVDLQGVIFSGGPRNVNEISEEQYSILCNFIDSLLKNKIPILGICFGLQLLAKYFGGTVQQGESGEFGNAKLHLTILQTLFHNNCSNKDITVWMSHQDKVKSLPEKIFNVTGYTENCEIAMIESKELNVYGCQFHPEVDNTEHGLDIYRKFIIDICKCQQVLNNNLIQNVYNEIVLQLEQGNDQGGKILIAVSGGVDSTILTHLLNNKYPNRIICVFINHGLMRKNEPKEIRKHFEFLSGNDNNSGDKDSGKRFYCVDAKQEFFEALSGITDPEQKRKVIGKMFIESFQNWATTQSKLFTIEWLAQGTIYPDVIESCGINKTSQVIKSHHNLSLPDTLNLKVLEPLKFLFKDQVRSIGEQLKLDHKLIYRHPFPGPGLGIRIVGEVRKDLSRILKKADKIFIDSLIDNQLYYSTSQAFASLFPVKTVGVVGDNRRYGWTIVLRAVTSGDFMTATVSDLELEFLTRVATRIVNECQEVGRVLFDITSKPPGTIEME